jgi:hypothetical protein
MKVALFILGTITSLHVAATFFATTLGIFDLVSGNGGPSSAQKWGTFIISLTLMACGFALTWYSFLNFYRKITSHSNNQKIIIFIGVYFVILAILGMLLWKQSSTLMIQFMSSHIYSLAIGVVAVIVCLLSKKQQQATMESKN